jgi:hypothetical protein
MWSDFLSHVRGRHLFGRGARKQLRFDCLSLKIQTTEPKYFGTKFSHEMSDLSFSGYFRYTCERDRMILVKFSTLISKDRVSNPAWRQ